MLSSLGLGMPAPTPCQCTESAAATSIAARETQQVRGWAVCCASMCGLLCSCVSECVMRSARTARAWAASSPTSGRTGWLQQTTGLLLRTKPKPPVRLLGWTPDTVLASQPACNLHLLRLMERRLPTGARPVCMMFPHAHGMRLDLPWPTHHHAHVSKTKASLQVTG